MLRILKVTGSSLHPEFQDGDFVLLGTCAGTLSRVRPGDVVVFHNAEYGTLIKRITHIEENDVHVRGTQIDSVDSRRLGPIPRPDLRGKVLWHIRKPR